MYLDCLMEECLVKKSRDILKNFFWMIFVNVFFLGAELFVAYFEKKPLLNIVYINFVCLFILLVVTIFKLVKKDYEISMYSAFLLLGCSISWVIPLCLYGSIFGENTGIVSGILYLISIIIGIFIPILQGKINRNKPFWITISKIATLFGTSIVAVLIVLGRIFRGSHGGRIIQNTVSITTSGKIMWGLVLFVAIIFGGFSTFSMIHISQNSTSEYNKNRKRIKR